MSARVAKWLFGKCRWVAGDPWGVTWPFCTVAGSRRLLCEEDEQCTPDWAVRRALHPRGMQHRGGEAGRLSAGAGILKSCGGIDVMRIVK